MSVALRIQPVLQVIVLDPAVSIMTISIPRHIIRVALQVIAKSSTPLRIPDFELSNLGVELFPVPSQDVLNIRTNRVTALEITVLDITGQVVMRDAMNSIAHQIDLSEQAPGIYLLQLRSGNSLVTERFSISR